MTDHTGPMQPDYRRRLEAAEARVQELEAKHQALLADVGVAADVTDQRTIVLNDAAEMWRLSAQKHADYAEALHDRAKAAEAELDRLRELYLAADKDATHWCGQFSDADAERRRLRDGITALADEWRSKGRMATDQANALAGDRRQPYLMDSGKYLRRAAELAALLTRRPPTQATTEAENVGKSAIT